MSPVIIGSQVGVKLVDELLNPPYNLTYVDTVRSNEKELPNEIKKLKDRPVGTSIIGFSGAKTKSIVVLPLNLNRTKFLFYFLQCTQLKNSNQKQINHRSFTYTVKLNVQSTH